MERLRGLTRRYPTASAAIACGVLSVLMFFLGWLSRLQGPQQGPRPIAAAALLSLAHPITRTAAHAAASMPAPIMPRPSPPAELTASGSAGSAGPGHAATANQAGRQATGAAKDLETGRADPFEPVVAPAATPAPGSDTPAAAAAAATEIQAAVKRSEPGLGRTNPFDPLISASVRFSPRAGAGMAVPLPPIPPFDPNGPMPGSGAAAETPGFPAGRDSAAPSGLRLVGFVMGRTALALIEDGGRSYLVAPGDLIMPGLRVVAVDAARQRIQLQWHGQPLELSGAIPVPP